MKRAFLSGNEAVARGAYEAGCHLAAAYPGTPSTEIVETIAKLYPEIKTEWSVNEKVAMEVVLGGSFAGARVLTAMKHVGLNVAADPFFSAAYIGATGGMVVVTADDPSMHSSQNEQDNRHYAVSAKVPMLEPSDSQEAKDFTILAFELSEKYDIPVLLRLTTRISHSRSVVELGERKEVKVKGYVKNPKKRIIIPAHARELHVLLEEKLKKLQEYAETTEINRVEPGQSDDFGVITSGISYNYVKEIFPDAWVLKLGMSFPFPAKLVREFASRFERLIIVEENDPFLETFVRATLYSDDSGLSLERVLEKAPMVDHHNLSRPEVIGKKVVPICWELSQGRLKRAFGMKTPETKSYPSPLPPRPPVLCPGCPHRATFYAIRKLRLHATGDIGCYTLGLMPPFNALDTTVCMGASISNYWGLESVLGEEFSKKAVAVIGDSTFFHSGITGLVNLVHGKSKGTVVILDNSTTAMTGHQPHPGIDRDARGEPAPKVELEELCKGVGIRRVRRVDAFNVKEVVEALKEEVNADEISVVIPTGKCVFVDKTRKSPMRVDESKCTGCKVCTLAGCPALSFDKKKNVAKIDPLLCTGCTVCAQLCRENAIVEGGEES